MEKIDRLDWTAGLTISAYGLRVGIRTNRPDDLEGAWCHFPPSWKPSSSSTVDCLYSAILGGPGANSKVRRFYVLYADHYLLVRALNLEEMLEVLEDDLQVAVAARARSRVFVHAGVVGWGDRAILLPGQSQSGKSTLVAALLKAGATYFSDEYAVLDGQGMVHPYPWPLRLRRRGGGRLRSPVVKADWGQKPLPIGWVIFSRFQKGKKWRLRRMSSGRALMELLSHTSSARLRPESSLSALRRVVSEAEVYKGPRGEAEVMASELLGSLSFRDV